MRILIKENQLKSIIKEYEDVYGYYEYLNDKTREVFSNIKNKTKIKFERLWPEPYLQALQEYMKHGQLRRFPEETILDWKMMMLNNVALLNILTSIHGHATYFPYDEFYDVFDEIPEEERTYDYTKVYEYLEEQGIDDCVPYFSNGHYVLSDYGLEPLEKLALKLIKEKSPEQILVLINMMLDITHQRSDLAEIFIHGGTSSLDMVSSI